jgi:hypothetical protein
VCTGVLAFAHCCHCSAAALHAPAGASSVVSSAMKPPGGTWAGSSTCMGAGVVPAAVVPAPVGMAVPATAACWCCTGHCGGCALTVRWLARWAPACHRDRNAACIAAGVVRCRGCTGDGCAAKQKTKGSASVRGAMAGAMSGFLCSRSRTGSPSNPPVSCSILVLLRPDCCCCRRLLELPGVSSTGGTSTAEDRRGSSSRSTADTATPIQGVCSVRISALFCLCLAGQREQAIVVTVFEYRRTGEGAHRFLRCNRIC